MNEPGTHKLSEALGDQAVPPTPVVNESGAPQPTAEQLAEDTRREQQARNDGREDRDDKLTTIGRGQQTHG